MRQLRLGVAAIESAWLRYEEVTEPVGPTMITTLGAAAARTASGAAKAAKRVTSAMVAVRIRSGNGLSSEGADWVGEGRSSPRGVPE